MKTIKSMMWLLMILLGLGISVLSLPQAANAQTDKENKEKRQAPGDDKDDGEKLSPKEAKKAKITMEAARNIALDRVSGQIVEEDLEKENGRLQYAFDIRTADGKVVDVEIDAMTGEVLKDDDDSEDNDDRSEKISAADAKQTKISMESARAIAINRVAGSVIEEDLEKENGRLQYAFDIRDSNGKVWDVEIDAMTGEVLKATDEDDVDGDNQQSGLAKTKSSVYRAVRKVKKVTVRAVGKLF